MFYPLRPLQNFKNLSIYKYEFKYTLLQYAAPLYKMECLVTLYTVRCEQVRMSQITDGIQCPSISHN